MINKIKLNNLGRIESLDAKLENINLFIGPNSSGKSFAMKTIYATLRAIQMNNDDGAKSTGELIGNKLVDCFYSGGHRLDLGALASLEREAPMQMEMTFESQSGLHEVAYEIPKNSQSDSVAMLRPSDSRTLTWERGAFFLPTKEVLTIYRAVIASREEGKLKNFDDTYYDLAVAISTATTKGKNQSGRVEARRELESLLGGKLKKESDRWGFQTSYRKQEKNHNSSAWLNLGALSEGVKKLSILDILLGNKQLEPGSVVFIDEPESALHPRTLKIFIDIIIILANESRIQFVIASHSYLVLHWLELHAKKSNKPLPLIDMEESNARVTDLREEVPENGIDRGMLDIYLIELERAFQ